MCGNCDAGDMGAQNDPPRSRVGTWNLEWARRAHVRPQQAKVIAEATAHVWVLTEARPGVLPHGWSSVTSLSRETSTRPSPVATSDSPAEGSN